MSGSFLTGKPRPVGGELHLLRSDEISISISRRRKRCWLSLGILKSPVKGKGGTAWRRPPVGNIPRTGTGNCAHTSKKDLISEVFFVITSCTRRQFSNPEFRGQDTAFSGKCLSCNGFRPPRHRGTGKPEREIGSMRDACRCPEFALQPRKLGIPGFIKPRSPGIKALRTGGSRGEALRFSHLHDKRHARDLPGID
jgi:hypothetical protein